jgi:hypothetical protein
MIMIDTHPGSLPFLQQTEQQLTAATDKKLIDRCIAPPPLDTGIASIDRVCRCWSGPSRS